MSAEISHHRSGCPCPYAIQILDKLGSNQRMKVETERGLLGLVTVGDEPCEQVDEEIDGTAMTRVLNLRDVLEVVNDGLNEGTLAQEQLVGERHEGVAHILAQVRDEPEALGEEELLSERRGEVALVGKEFAKELMGEARNWSSVVESTRGKTEREQLAMVIDDQMELEAVEPAHRRTAAPGIDTKDTMLRDPRRMADGAGR